MSFAFSAGVASPANPATDYYHVIDSANGACLVGGLNSDAAIEVTLETCDTSNTHQNWDLSQVSS
jgi:hypothetical protein